MKQNGRRKMHISFALKHPKEMCPIAVSVICTLTHLCFFKY